MVLIHLILRPFSMLRVSNPLNSMAYEHWNEEAEDFSCLDWCPIKDVMQAIRKCQAINFSVVEQRGEALTIINQIRRDAPFTMHVRFPEPTLYVCLSRGGWPRKLTQVMEALNFKETTLTKKEESKMGVKGNDPRSGFYSGDDALHAFHQGLTNMVNEIATRDEVWGRVSTEARLGLTWA